MKYINFKRFSLSLAFQVRYLIGSKHKIYQEKNKSILIVEDTQSKLPYMAEVELDDGSKGIVIKIQEKQKAYIAMYQQFKSSSKDPSIIQIVKTHPSWKDSVKNLTQQIFDSKSHLNNKRVYNVNMQKILEFPNTLQTALNNQNCELINAYKRRLKFSSPILNICHDLYYGDMISFMGCKGSKRSLQSRNLARQFVTQSQQNIAIYVNPNFQQVKSFSQACSSSFSFTISEKQKPTDVGVYMLAVKAIKLSSELKSKGLNVLLIVDNLSDIIYRQWNLLQSIKFDSRSIDSSNIFQYNTLKIPPVSILNEIYSSCEDNQTVKARLHGTSEKKYGSMTSILISEKENNELVQEITSYSNNLKHLQTLSYVIEFPLNLKINRNVYYPRVRSDEEFKNLQQEKGFEEMQLHQFLRNCVNKYLQEKNETELKRQLYKNDIREAPWDYFFLLDSEWWITGIKDMSSEFKSFKEANQFLKWLAFNIQHQYVGNWNLSAKESYTRLLSYLKNQQNLDQGASSQHIVLNQEELNAFIDDAKMEGLINPFKKDYLI